ncbi:rho GTPase-activating protein gacK [Drosophila pseudoobscura]|uniref:Rho GTPase-activating protein gacK n=1 Tax=Drosophila pseudoobscura pseudoobscura TaxID=46245 RepID=Q29GA7_DROPS|nr:rho GTPase-activating protein gacK [Drosophila pseudoobscura]
MDVEIPVLAGYLNVPTQTGFSLNRISKKKPCSRYCLLFKASRHGIARLEMCENKDDKNPKIFTLENCVKITQDPPPDKLIHIVKHNGTLTVNTNSDEELKDWITALQTVAFCDTAAGGHAVHGGAIEEDNDLYCSSFDGLFMITLIPSEASIRCSIEPKTYMLQMTPTELQLKSEDLNVTIAMWPYRFIRKYGYRDGKFTFEAGRKCTTGEGVFTLDHTNPQEVFRCMSAKMKSMKKLISGDSLSTIECGENQFSAAAGMEPGSRSPLPPSPSSNPHAGEFEINSTQSCISLRGFISSNDSLNNFAASNGSGGAAAAGGAGGGVVTSVTLSVPPNSCSSSSSKHIPNKPPRKLGGLVPASGPGSQNHCDKYKNIVKYEPVAITTSSPSDANSKNGGGSGSSMVILKPPSPETTTSRSGSTSSISSTPPDLPLRNESTKPLLERDYECIENITEAWRTRGVGDVRHCERIPPILCDTSDFVRSRSGSTRKDLASQSSVSNTPKIIDIDIGEGVTSPTLAVTSNNSVGVLMSSSDSNYDRLDFLSPNNKTSSGYKTIVNVTLPGNRVRCSPPPPNEYELIASPDTESFRKADDSHLGYGVLRKSTSANNNNSNNNNNIGISSNNNSNATTNKSNNESALDHRSYNGLNYTIVSKPKRV